MERKMSELLPTRALSTREQIILLEGSKLNGFIFLPWTSSPGVSEFELNAGESPYLDKVELRLSDVQRKMFNGWQRPHKAFPLPSLQQPDVFSGSGPTMTSHASIDLVQDITSDCSVVASLCAGNAREQRGHSKLISTIMFPYDYHLMQPKLSPNGKYLLRLHFNGCFRKVVIDDRLPTSNTEQALHVVDRNNPGLLWPALIEKAYLKVRGGYDFPGSNSGTDIWVLTGWVPEQLFLQRDDTSPNALWRRVFTAFGYGDVLVTVGTGKLTQHEEDGIGLIGEHDYAIINMKETEGRRLFLVKNPWSEGTTWRGSIVNRPPESEFRSDDSSRTERLAPGTFWMELNDVFQSFESMYLNWNPGLFSFREDVHFAWDLAASSAGGSFYRNPQFEVRSARGGTAWFLLSRHFKSISRTSNDSGTEPWSISGIDYGFMSLYAFDHDGRKVVLSDGALIRGVYVDSPNTLIKLELSAGKGYTIVVSEQALPASSYNFTLAAFSLNSLIIEKAREVYSHHISRNGAWTSTSSGGNASSIYYHMNPQFSIQISTGSDVSLLLEAPADNFPVHVKLLWGNGKATASITTRDIVGDSGEYRKGCALAEIHNVQAGTYTIICSTFERGQLGTFSLQIDTSSSCIVERILAAEAGLLVLGVPTAFFPSGIDRLLAPLTSHRINRISLLAHLRQSRSTPIIGSGSPLKLAVEYGQGPCKQVLAVSGDDEFLDSKYGIRTKEVDIHPSMCDQRGLWVVVQRLGYLGLQHDEEVDVEILSDGPIKLGIWGTGDG